MGGLELGFAVGVEGFHVGVWEDLTSVCHFTYFPFVPLLPVPFLPVPFFTCAIFTGAIFT